jgi:DNA modification methylase
MTRLTTPPRNITLVGDALQRLRTLPDQCIDCVLTSPAYLKLRDYGTEGQMGMEATAEEWVANLRRLMKEIHRVLVPSGTLWLNLGDTYAKHAAEGAPRKSFLMAPERLILALIVDGWSVRNKIVWNKPNGMPTSVKDRLATKWEPVYLLSKQSNYFFDADAIRIPATSRLSKQQRTTAAVRGRNPVPKEDWRGPNADTTTGLVAMKALGRVAHPLGKNPGDVWTIPTTGYRAPGQVQHHATFPLALAERAIRAGTPEARCRRCGTPWKRALVTAPDGAVTRGDLKPTCTCGAESEPGLVLDPFLGSGTTAVAAENLGRDWLGVELNPEFARLAEDRITAARLERQSETERMERAA